ncbi:DUF2244 domain-containing protein [Pseudoroseicyclus aestuarii]|uniref:Putative membrane protein n=1 Tax=Pseudoroseicyclus aestuarii TaxID=1795041 RepID=A0A318SMI9_9RHOB|nr:DUF2244 domain-containing protein [Pseudoroseicyclus aestuarii]PYE80916.1 putative membrane protein [Pseudoroseicyclus aestuarii]
MPYEWLPPRKAEGGGRIDELHLWPYRSLPKRGFVTFIGTTLALVCLPLLAVLGSPVLWGILPFIGLAIWGVWGGIARSYSDGSILERLVLAPGVLRLTRDGPRGRSQSWEGQPYWTSLEVHPKGGPVAHYLTLKGAGREVEIGAFLTEEERRALEPALREALERLRRPQA